MALIEKLEAQVETKASADDIYKIFGREAHRIADISDPIIGVEVLEGDWKISGSVMQWSYTIEGNTLSVKERVEMDEGNKKVTYNILDGEVMKQLKSFKPSVQASPKEGGGAIVKWILEYEKLNEDVPSLNNYLDLVQYITKEIDNYLISNP